MMYMNISSFYQACWCGGLEEFYRMFNQDGDIALETKEAPLPVLVIEWNILETVIKTIGMRPAETGGPLGGVNGAISHFSFDQTGQVSSVTYSPDVKKLNSLFKTEWNPVGVRLRGFIHSHPSAMRSVSGGDMSYVKAIFNAIRDLHFLWLPIVNTVPETGQFVLTPWFASRKGNDEVEFTRGQIQVVNIPVSSDLEVGGQKVLDAVRSGIPMDDFRVGNFRRFFREEAVSGRAAIAEPFAPEEERAPESGESAETDTAKSQVAAFASPSEEKSVDLKLTFDRVKEAYDLEIMESARIFAVGAGGAASWLEELARAGVRQFVIIDPDVVSETNLATQQTYRRDIGRPKVDCIAERIMDINPAAKVIALQKKLDEINDEEVRRLALAPIGDYESERTVICGLTDNFFAQARVNKIALNFGLPSLCAQVYKEGRGAEITFTFPGVTPACHRCILSSRYRYFLDQAKENDVTSHGTPIFATTRLNAIKGFITLALLHHGSNHPRWGNMLSRIGARNLLQVRMDPDLAETIKMTVFNRVFEKADQNRLFFDEVVWLPEKQECPETGYSYHCPDCGGSGDLRDAIGRFRDTTIMEKDNNV
jgi:hypothetical protein